jgi:AraC-like DNA-binding protein
MLIFSYTADDYSSILNKFARYFKRTVRDNKFELPPEAGKGFFQFIQLPLGIQVSLADFKLYEDFLLVRKASSFSYINLRFDILQSDEPVKMVFNEDENKMMQNTALLFLTDSTYSIIYKAPKNTSVKSLNLMLTPDTLHQLLPMMDTQNLIDRLVKKGQQGIRLITADSTLMQIMDELLHEAVCPEIKDLFVFNRCMTVIEKFLTALHENNNDDQAVMRGISRSDTEAVKEIERMITDNLAVLPPHQEELAAKALMSVSKLKYTFKSLYGNSIYNYYQKARMHRAFEMLQAGDSVSSTAEQLGFKSIDNFTKNFKAEFHILPSRISLINFPGD